MDESDKEITSSKSNNSQASSAPSVHSQMLQNLSTAQNSTFEQQKQPSSPSLITTSQQQRTASADAPLIIDDELFDSPSNSNALFGMLIAAFLILVIDSTSQFVNNISNLLGEEEENCMYYLNSIL